MDQTSSHWVEVDDDALILMMYVFYSRISLAMESGFFDLITTIHMVFGWFTTIGSCSFKSLRGRCRCILTDRSMDLYLYWLCSSYSVFDELKVVGVSCHL